MDTLNIGKIERLHDALKDIGISGRGMYRRISEKTGYTPSQVGKVLNGKAELTGRFITAACNAFGLNEYWILYGVESQEEDDRRIDDAMRRLDDQIYQATGKMPLSMLHAAVTDNVTCQEAVKELLKMSEAERWRAVAMLKEMNAGKE